MTACVTSGISSRFPQIAKVGLIKFITLNHSITSAIFALVLRLMSHRPKRVGFTYPIGLHFHLRHMFMNPTTNGSSYPRHNNITSKCQIFTQSRLSMLLLGFFSRRFFAHLQHSPVSRKLHLCLNTRSQYMYKVNDSAQQKVCAFGPHCKQTSVLTLCTVKATPSLR